MKGKRLIITYKILPQVVCVTITSNESNGSPEWKSRVANVWIPMTFGQFVKMFVLRDWIHIMLFIDSLSNEVPKEVCSNHIFT